MPPHGERQHRRRVPRGFRRFDISHVASAGETEEPALPVQQVIELVDAEPSLPVKVHQNGRVDVAGARAHDETLQGGEAHARVNRASTRDRRHRCTIAEVQHDDAQLLEVAVEERRRPLGDVLVRGAVKPVPPHTVALRQLYGDRVGVRLGRHGLVERGVEDGDMRHVRENSTSRLDAEQIGRIMQRRERRKAFDRGLNLRRDHGRAREQRPTVDDPMTHRGNTGDRASRDLA